MKTRTVNGVEYVAMPAKRSRQGYSTCTGCAFSTELYECRLTQIGLRADCLHPESIIWQRQFDLGQGHQPTK